MQNLKQSIVHPNIIKQLDNSIIDSVVDNVDNVDNVDTVDNVDNVDNAIQSNNKSNLGKSKKRKNNTELDQVINELHIKPVKPVDDVLANLIDNVLDNNRINKKQKRDISFNSQKNGKNVIKSIKPLDNNNNNVHNNIHSHFNSDTHPDEIYNIEFLDGKYSETKAIDISENALKTQKLTFEHNQKLNQIYPNILPSATNTVIYTRCSIKNDISIETQKQACFTYAFNNNMKMVPFGYLEDNGVSGRNGKNLKSGEIAFWSSHIPNHSTIIVYSPDRWCRNTLKGLEILDSLSKRDITVHFVTNNIDYNKNISSANRAMIQNELMTAEKLSNDTSEKIKGTLSRLKAEGHIIGRAPYGFSNVVINGIRKRITNNDETNIIHNIKNKYNDVYTNLDNYCRNDNVRRSEISIITFIMRWCNRNGIKHRKGNTFTFSQIKSIVDSN